MYEYRCEIVKVIDGDTVDVDIDLGFGVLLRKERIGLEELTHQNQEQEMLKKRNMDYLLKIFYKNYYTTII